MSNIEKKYLKYKSKYTKLSNKFNSLQYGAGIITTTNGIGIDDRKLVFFIFDDNKLKQKPIDENYSILSTGTPDNYTVEIVDRIKQRAVMRLTNNKKSFILNTPNLSIEISGDLLDFDKKYLTCIVRKM